MLTTGIQALNLKIKGTVSRESLQKFRSAKTHLQQQKPSRGRNTWYTLGWGGATRPFKP